MAGTETARPKRPPVYDIPDEDMVLTPAEAAAVLGVKVQDLRRLEALGKLRARRTLGGHRRFREDRVRALAEERARISASVNGVSANEMLTSGQVAAVFRVGRRRVREWVEEGKIAGEWTDGHRLRIPAAEVARLLREGGDGP